MEFTKDPSTHPANGPLSVERLIRVREWLQSSLAYSEGSNRDYMMADAAKAIDELLELLMAGQEPVADVLPWSHKNSKRTCDIRWRRHDLAPGPLYAAPQLPKQAVVPDGLNPQTADLVLRFSSALAEKLYKAEQKYGRSTDWMKKDWYNDCLQSLWEHIEKGDPRDVAAYCAFMWHHGWVTTDYDRSVQSACRAAMLQGSRRDLSNPVDPQVAAYEKIMQQAMPDGWVSVPVAPTESMIIAGFEAELREEFRDPEAWEAFEAMSGCEQAALRAKWCWAAMIAAAPQQEMK